MKKLATLSICWMISLIGYSQKLNLFKSKAPELPDLFAPGVISDQFGNRNMAISPDASEFMYTLQYKSGAYSGILYCKYKNGKWSVPDIAPFSGQYNDLEPAYAPDGSKLYFVSNRPLTAQGKVKDYDIWLVEKNAHGDWGSPVILPSPVNTSKNEFYPAVTSSGNIYFTREMPDQDEDIVVCTWNGSGYDDAVSLPAAINSNKVEFNAYIDADEQFILYTAYRREGNSGSGEIYISFKNEEGHWGTSSNLGPKINDSGLTYCPYVSPDKKYFFFTSSRWSAPPFDSKKNLKQIKTLLSSPMNGWDNIYFMDASTILSKK